MTRMRTFLNTPRGSAQLSSATSRLEPGSPAPAAAPGGPAGIATAAFRQALSRFATGVTVICTHAPGAVTEGAPFVGLTASSFNSVSLEPPLVLWSLGKQARSLALFEHSTHYLVNVLAADQLALCQRFAWGQGDRFAGLDYTLSPAGLPVLGGALAWFECRNRSRYDEGDHLIFVGEVLHCDQRESGEPLVYQASRFARLQALP
jgi:flavin reductase (DIM6/NTAB) family NADH-FMN oxidoreductase RutF